MIQRLRQLLRKAPEQPKVYGYRGDLTGIVKWKITSIDRKVIGKRPVKQK